MHFIPYITFGNMSSVHRESNVGAQRARGHRRCSSTEKSLWRAAAVTPRCDQLQGVSRNLVERIKTTHLRHSGGMQDVKLHGVKVDHVAHCVGAQVEHHAAPVMAAAKNRDAALGELRELHRDARGLRENGIGVVETRQRVCVHERLQV